MKEFTVPPVVFPSGANPAAATVPSSVQQRRVPTVPFQPSRPAASSIPFVSFDIGSTSLPSNPAIGGPTPLYGDNTSAFSEELSLLEELEIDPSLIYRKTLSLLNPLRVNSAIHDPPDLSGPFLLYMLFALFQVLARKVQFGVLLGYIVIFSIGLYVIFNMLEGKSGKLDLYRCFSCVGYSLFPVVIYSAVSLFLSPRGVVSFAVAALFVLWSTRICASLLIERASGGYAQFGLIAYPCFLIYTLFSMLVVF